MSMEPPKELQDKEVNSTMFENCGWCKYACGKHRYNYCIDGKCILQKKYSKDVHWFTSCLFNNASVSEINSIIKNKKYYINEYKTAIKELKSNIDILKELKQKAIYLPTLPEDREYDYFKIDDDIMVNMNEQWYSGKVVSGYRTHDGFVSYHYFSDYNMVEGSCGNAFTGILLKKEYEYFQTHQDDYDDWCEKAYDKDFNGKIWKPLKIRS